MALFRRRRTANPTDAPAAGVPAHQRYVPDRHHDFPPPVAADERRIERGRLVAVHDEEHYQAALARAAGAHDLSITPQPVLAELDIVRVNPWSSGPFEPAVEVRLGEEPVGYLAQDVASRVIPLIETAHSAGQRMTTEAELSERFSGGASWIEIRLHARLP